MVNNFYAALHSVEWANPNGGSTGSHWKVTFTLVADSLGVEFPVWLRADTPDEDVVRIGRARLHEILQAAVDHTKDWKIP